MKKVINITIGKMVFLIEDDAYQSLDRYLTDIRRYFSGDSEGDDVLEDIESSIAEKFASRGMNTKNAIGQKDVEEIISLMGTVEELAGDNDLGDDLDKGKSRDSKRLYRDTDDVIIGGVASGIAKYFGIDPVVTRVLFVIFGVFGGFGIPTYILLWIIVPAADTSSKKIHMKGGKATISEIETFVKEKIDEVPKGKWKKFFSFPFLVLKKIFEFIFKIIKKAGPILSGIIGVAISLTALVSLFAFSISFVALVSGGGNADPVISAVTGVLSAGSLGLAALVSLYFLVFVPLLALVFFGILLVRRKKILGWVGSSILFVAWFISANIVSAMALTSIDEIRSGIDKAHSEVKASYAEEAYTDLSGFDSVDISGSSEVNFVKGDEYSVLIEGSEMALEALRVESQDGKLRVYRDHDFYICIFYCSDIYSNTTITVTTPELKEVSFSGSVNGKMDNFQSDSFSARFSGSASFAIDVDTKDLEVRVTGSGKVVLLGAADSLNLRLSGSSKIDGFDMVSKSAFIRSSGSARVNLSTEESLDVRSSGSTKVVYVDLGDTVVTERISGSGSVSEFIESE